MMNNGFHVILKTLLVLKIFNILLWLFDNVKKPGLIRKVRLFSKLMTSQSD